MNQRIKVINTTNEFLENDCNTFAEQMDALNHRITSMRPYFKEDRVFVFITIDTDPIPRWVKKNKQHES